MLKSISVVRPVHRYAETLARRGFPAMFNLQSSTEYGMKQQQVTAQ
jgi:hypothetical protein